MFDHSLSTFDDVNPSLSGIAVNLLDKMVHSYAGFHFTRKHPAKVAQLGPKMAAKVLEVADELRSVSVSFPRANSLTASLTDFDLSGPFRSGQQDPSESVLIHMLTDLVDIYNTLWIQDRLSTDATNTVDSLQILPALLFQLRIRYPLLEGFGPVLVSAGQDPSRYKQALKSFHAALFPEEYKTRRGSEFISCDIGGAKHSPWWTCDATHPTKGVTTSSACRVVPRADLLACGQVRAAAFTQRSHNNED